MIYIFIFDTKGSLKYRGLIRKFWTNMISHGTSHSFQKLYCA
jgi:hypothetical protein